MAVTDHFSFLRWWQGFRGRTLPSLGREIFNVSWMLFKLMVPVLIVVRVLEELGAIPVIARVLEPLMTLVGLPEAMGLVLATNLITNIYAGLMVFFQLVPDYPMTVAQVSILGGMMLVAHSLPLEVRIVQIAGVRLIAALIMRLVTALIFGVLLFHIYDFFNWLQHPAELVWQPEVQQVTLSAWVWQQLQSFAMIVLVIASLISLLRFLRWIHVERLMIFLLKPVLRLLGIRPEAASLTIVGMTLGLSFGGGLLIEESRKGHINKKDIFAAMLLLSVCHSLIEDTLLIMVMGADISAALWFRLIFSLTLVAVVTRALRYASDTFWQTYLVTGTVSAPHSAPTDIAAETSTINHEVAERG
ncbi:hypothetical protein [Oceanospirillum linum]|nr:hypothetical protein [Oceanospirillum linum]SEG01647.1 hypothetical protein SAMN04489856_104108 [Oleiphilus messinensis]SMP21794.1 hypothetical protein SAMN06264348_104150 [Oceanospirillum linum]